MLQHSENYFSLLRYPFMETGFHSLIRAEQFGIKVPHQARFDRIRKIDQQLKD